MSNLNKKIVIFDMDGVLFDTIPFAREEFLKRHPGLTGKMYDEIHSGNFHEGARKYSHLKVKETPEEEKKYLANYAEKKGKARMFGGMRDLLIGLHDLGYTLILNTNAYARNCLPLLESSGINKLFDLIASAEISKDKIEKFETIARRYDVSKKDLFFVTDALGDVKDADAAGVPTVAVTWGVHNKAYFEREKHSNLVGTVDSVEGLLKQIKNFNS